MSMQPEGLRLPREGEEFTTVQDKFQRDVAGFREFTPGLGAPVGGDEEARNQFIRNLANAAEAEGWTNRLKEGFTPEEYAGIRLSYSSAGPQFIATRPAADGLTEVLYSDGTIRLENLNAGPRRGGGGAGGSTMAGSTMAGTRAGMGGTAGFTSEQMTAREFLVSTMRQYFASSQDAGFVDQMTKIIENYIREGYDADTISLLLPQTEPYKQRFIGNEGRIKSGLKALSPAEYLQAEETYNEILTRFNLSDLAKRDTFSALIGGQVSAAELSDRVVNVYDRIRNADQALRSEINRVSELSAGALTEADFAKALLTGDTGAAELKRKITMAEISAEARTRNLGTGSAEELMKLGVTREQARTGFETIAQAQPTFEKLAGIYDRTPVNAEATQKELEAEVFQGMQSQRRKRLAEQEITAFAGSSGLGSTALRANLPKGRI